MAVEYLRPRYYRDYLMGITCPELQLKKLRELRIDNLNDLCIQVDCYTKKQIENYENERHFSSNR